MLQTKKPQKVLLIGLLLLLSAGRTDSVSAGTNVWTSNGPRGGSINALAINLAMPTTLYVGTEFSGVFISTNGGADWNAINTGLTSTNARALAIDPTTPATLYAGTDSDGMFKSANGGESWNASNTDLTCPNIDEWGVGPATRTTL